MHRIHLSLPTMAVTASIANSYGSMLDAGFAVAVGSLVVGILAGAFLTNFLRANVYDAQFMGADVLYGVVAAGIVGSVGEMLGFARFARPMMLGIVGGAVFDELTNLGVLPQVA